MRKQIGARFLARKNKAEKEVVCTQYYKTDEPYVVVKPGVLKRPRITKRKAD